MNKKYNNYRKWVHKSIKMDLMNGSSMIYLKI